MPDVAFYEIFKEEKAAIKKLLPPNIRAAFFPETIQEREGGLPAPLISIRTQSIVPDFWAPKLRGILSRTTGYDHVLTYLRKNRANIPCGYLPIYCSRAVAEQAMLMMLALLRKLRLQEKHFGRFNRDGITGHECQGRKLLVLGVGRIGSQMAALARGLGMRVRGVDIEPRRRGVYYVPLKQGMGWADVILCALPLTDQTRGLLDYAAFRRCRPGVVFVNVARGEISPLKDLRRLLKEKILAGLAMDVFEDEGRMAELLRAGKKATHPTAALVREMMEKENVLFTPHNAFNTVEAVERKAKQSVRAVLCFLDKGSFPDAVPREPPQRHKEHVTRTSKP